MFSKSVIPRRHSGQRPPRTRPAEPERQRPREVSRGEGPFASVSILACILAVVATVIPLGSAPAQPPSGGAPRPRPRAAKPPPKREDWYLIERAGQQVGVLSVTATSETGTLRFAEQLVFRADDGLVTISTESTYREAPLEIARVDVTVERGGSVALRGELVWTPAPREWKGDRDILRESYRRGEGAPIERTHSVPRGAPAVTLGGLPILAPRLLTAPGEVEVWFPHVPRSLSGPIIDPGGDRYRLIRRPAGPAGESTFELRGATPGAARAVDLELSADGRVLALSLGKSARLRACPEHVARRWRRQQERRDADGKGASGRHGKRGDAPSDRSEGATGG